MPIKTIIIEDTVQSAQQFTPLQNQINLTHDAVSTFKLEKVSYKERFLVQAGKKLLPISVKEMAYFYADAKLTLVVLKNGRQYIINHTLAELEQLLHPKYFYRINRKVIVNLEAVHSLQMGKNYKWMLNLAPAPDFKVPIPTDKLTHFKQWVC